MSLERLNMLQNISTYDNYSTVSDTYTMFSTRFCA